MSADNSPTETKVDRALRLLRSFHGTYEEHAKEIEKLRDAGRWIRVSDELPPEHSSVLAWWPYWCPVPVVARFATGTDWFCDCKLHDSGDLPTHWMHLPRRPHD